MRKNFCKKYKPLTKIEEKFYHRTSLHKTDFYNNLIQNQLLSKFPDLKVNVSIFSPRYNNNDRVYEVENNPKGIC